MDAGLSRLPGSLSSIRPCAPDMGLRASRLFILPALHRGAIQLYTRPVVLTNYCSRMPAAVTYPNPAAQIGIHRGRRHPIHLPRQSSLFTLTRCHCAHPGNPGQGRGSPLPVFPGRHPLQALAGMAYALASAVLGLA